MQILPGYPTQAQYHCETARSIMMSGVQLSSDSTDQHRIMEVLINIHYTLGRALTASKKYPYYVVAGCDVTASEGKTFIKP